MTNSIHHHKTIKTNQEISRKSPVSIPSFWPNLVKSTMPVYNLQCSAECENVATISGDAETIWRMKVECSSCQDVSPNFIEVSSTEEVEVPGTRGVCNCLYTCKW